MIGARKPVYDIWGKCVFIRIDSCSTYFDILPPFLFQVIQWMLRLVWIQPVKIGKFKYLIILHKFWYQKDTLVLYVIQFDVPIPILVEVNFIHLFFFLWRNAVKSVLRERVSWQRIGCSEKVYHWIKLLYKDQCKLVHRKQHHHQCNVKYHIIHH